MPVESVYLLFYPLTHDLKSNTTSSTATASLSVHSGYSKYYVKAYVAGASMLRCWCRTLAHTVTRRQLEWLPHAHTKARGDVSKRVQFKNLPVLVHTGYTVSNLPNQIHSTIQVYSPHSLDESERGSQRSTLR